MATASERAPLLDLEPALDEPHGPVRWHIDTSHPLVRLAMLFGALVIGGLVLGQAGLLAPVVVEASAAPVPAVASSASIEKESEPVDDDEEDVLVDDAPKPATPKPEPKRRATSPDAPAGENTGYRNGQMIKLRLVIVDGKPVEEHTAAAYKRMKAAAAKAGVNIVIASGFRTMERQRELYADYLAGRGNLAAVPGHSNHQSGLALDLNTRAPKVLQWLEAHGKEYGFRRTVPSEAWHWEYR